MVDDCITISDDEDVEVVEQIVNIQPIVGVVDLTEDEANQEIGKTHNDQDRQPILELSPEAAYHRQQQLYAFQPDIVKTHYEHPSKPKKPRLEPRQLHRRSLKQSRQPKQQPILGRDYLESQKKLGNQKYRNNHFDDAIRIFKKAISLARILNDREISATLHFNLAMSYFKVNSFDQAADECGNAAKYNPDYLKAHLKRAEIYLQQHKFNEAVICYEHICEIDGSKPYHKRLLQRARDLAKRIDKKEDYCQVLGLNQNFTKEDLKRAFRQKALSHHPDRHFDADIITRRIEEKRFKEASEAYSILQKRFC